MTVRPKVKAADDELGSLMSKMGHVIGRSGMIGQNFISLIQIRFGAAEKAKVQVAINKKSNWEQKSGFSLTRGSQRQ